MQSARVSRAINRPILYSASDQIGRWWGHGCSANGRLMRHCENDSGNGAAAKKSYDFKTRVIGGSRSPNG